VASYERNGFGLYLVVLKQQEVPIGICGLIKRESLADVDVGFALLPQFRKQGYAFESASAVLSYSKSVLKIDRIVAITSVDNVASGRLLEKLGMRFEKVIKLSPDGESVKLFAPNS
jgi:RimJ/RimL family protein N-acetyltransferase